MKRVRSNDLTQTTLFDGQIEYKIDKPIRLIELFGGIGCQASALERLGVKFEHYRMCDFDKYAVQSYNAIHGTNFVPSDITKINADDLGIIETDKYCYIMTYSFPCQSLSLAGKQEGMSRESGTRSGLLWEVERLLKECKELPQVLLMENVPQVHGKKNIDSFKEWCAFLESKGYKNYWKDLNAKHYGIPQNRNRTFMVSLLGNYTYEFPEPIELKLRLKDMLEDEVDEKYYLSDKMINYVMSSGTKTFYVKPEIDLEIARPLTTKQDKRAGTTNYVSDKYKTFIEENGYIPEMFNPYNKTEIKDIAPTQSTQCGSTTSSATVLKITKLPLAGHTKVVENLKTQLCNKLIEENRVQEFDKQITEFEIKENEFESSNRAYYENGVCPTITTIDAPKIVQVAQLDGFESSGRVYSEDGLAPIINAMGGGNREPKIAIKNVKNLRHEDEFFSTLGTNCGSSTSSGGGVVVIDGVYNNYRIRKLTAKESWRLMGLTDEQFDKAKASGVSNSQLYKQAGNGICVNVLMAIFKKLF